MRRAIATLSIALLLFAPVAVAEHGPDDGELDFVLSNDQSEDDNWIQYKNAHQTELTVTVTSCETWIADEPADLDLTFPAQVVEYDIDATLTLINGERIEVTVGVYDPGNGNFNGVASSLGLIGTMDAPEFDIPEDDHLATQLCIQDSGETDGSAVIDTDGSSVVTYTDEATPEYPTPELGTLLLSATGLVAVVGLARFRRDG